MPLVDLVHRPDLPEAVLRALADAVPDVVSRAVACPEEPYDGDLRPGDVEVRLRRRDPRDPPGLDVVVEIGSTWTVSRETDRQERCAAVHAELSPLVPEHSLGVYLSLPVAAWAQDE